MRSEPNGGEHYGEHPPPEVFISYSRLDTIRCQPIVEALRSAGFTIWIDSESITPGKNWVTAIFHQLDRSDFVLVLLTRNALKSPWVEKEYQTALVSGIAGKSGVIIPVLLDSVRLPAELRTIQCVDLSSDREQGLSELIRQMTDSRTTARDSRYAEAIPKPSSPSNDRSALGTIFGQLRTALIGAMKRTKRAHGDVELCNRLLDLHEDLLRLENVVSLISQTSPKDCAQIWKQATRLTPGPIPGASSVLLSIDHAISNSSTDATGCGTTDFDFTKEQLLLLRHYIEVLRDLSESLRGPVPGFLHLRAPEAAEQLAEIWKTKVFVRRSLRMRDKNLTSTLLLGDQDLLTYVEAGRLLESRMLTQLIDEDARGVAMDPESGLVALEELSLKHKEVTRAIVATRRELGRLINAYWPDAYKSYGGRNA